MPAILIVPISLALPFAKPTKTSKLPADNSIIENEQKYGTNLTVNEQTKIPMKIETSKLSEEDSLLANKNGQTFEKGEQQKACKYFRRICTQIKVEIEMLF